MRLQHHVTLLIVMCLAATALAHPKPGAHADVRITIERDSVQVNCVANLLFADQIVNAPRKVIDDVTPDEEPVLREAMAEYFGGARQGSISRIVTRGNSVMIDGVAVSPIIRELTIVRPEPETRPGFIANPALMIPRIHVIAEYPTKTPAKTVTFVWGAFPRDYNAAAILEPLPSDIEAVLLAGDQMDLITFKKSEPEITWHAPANAGASRMATVPAIIKPRAIMVPVISVVAVVAWAVFAFAGFSAHRRRPTRLAVVGVLAGVTAFATAGLWRLDASSLIGTPLPKLTSEEAMNIFRPLHANIYRAFDYSSESDIYDALARSVDGPMLDKVYQEVYRGLVMQEEGGAVSRVKSVDVLESSVRDVGIDKATKAASFVVEAKWRVEGVVYHWGHSHTRTNEYRAEYMVAGGDDGWRIVFAKPLEQRRIQTPEQAASEAALMESTPDSSTDAPNTTTWSPNR